MHKYKIALCAVALAAAASGCASEPTLGDMMISQSSHTESLGKQWNRGNSLLRDGEKARDSGESLVDRGESKIRQGDQMIEQGKALIAESESAFRAKFPQSKLQP